MIFHDDDKVYPALEAGATSYILKTSKASEIARAIRNTHRGESVFESDVGDEKLEDVISKIASVASSDGDISIEQAQGEWNIQSSVGEVDLHLREWEQDITIASDIGDIEVQVARKADYTLELDTDIGEVKIDMFDLNLDEGKEVYLQSGSGEPLLKVSSDLGDIEVTKP